MQTIQKNKVGGGRVKQGGASSPPKGGGVYNQKFIGSQLGNRTSGPPDKLLTNISVTPETWSTSVSLVTTSSLTTTSALFCGTLDTTRQPRAPKWIKYDQRLQKIADDFESYTNVLDYLKAVGNMTMLK